MHGSNALPRLEFAVHSLRGEEILPPGAVPDEAALAAAAVAGRTRRWERRFLLEHGSIRSDLASTTRAGAYATIFGNEAEHGDLERSMARVRLAEPYLLGLDWFKAHDVYTYRHILAVFSLSYLLAQRLGRTGPESAVEAVAGPLHDFGKLCIPPSILAKRTALTRPERRLLEQHTLAGHVLLCHYSGDLQYLAARVALDHHERRDGSGYLRGIRLDDALVEIVAVCDIYDALVSSRPYRRRSFDNRSALEELTAMAEAGRFAPEIVRTLIALNRRGRPAPECCTVSTEKRGAAPAGNLYGVYSDGDGR